MRVEGLETLDYLDNLKNKERFTEQGDAITFESEVSDFSNVDDSNFMLVYFMFLLSLTVIIYFMVKIDKIYLSTPTKIAILDHERKRTFVLRKDGLPDAGKLAMTIISAVF